jgi:ATP-binding cassette subfamily B protein
MSRNKASKNISIKRVLIQFWKGLKPYKWQFFLAYFFFALSQTALVLIPIFYKKFFDTISNSVNTAETTGLLIKVLVVISSLRFANWIFWRFGISLFNYMESKVIARLKQYSFDYLLGHSHTFFANNFGGGLVQKVNRLARSFEQVCDSMAFNFLPLTAVAIGSVWVTWYSSPVISYIIITWISSVVIFSVLFSRWKIKYDNLVAEADSRTTGYLADSITNNSAVSFFTGVKYESKKFKDVTNDQADKTLFSWKLGDITDAVMTFFILVVEFLIFYYCIKYWGRGLITVGTFVLAQTYIVSLSAQLWGVGKIIRNIYQSISDAKEMVEILEMKHEISDNLNAKKLIANGGEIFFENVNFGFSKNEEVIQNLNVKIKAGEKVAIVGPSGAGKTTFVRLIMRVYDITSGQILIDGQDIKEVTQESLRENISFVQQDPVLFHRTLMDNIRYGRRDATDDEVIQAAKLAHCDEFIDKLPLKYNTFVGERGIKLSGGERQRVAIADK